MNDGVGGNPGCYYLAFFLVLNLLKSLKDDVYHSKSLLPEGSFGLRKLKI